MTPKSIRTTGLDPTLARSTRTPRPCQKGQAISTTSTLDSDIVELFEGNDAYDQDSPAIASTPSFRPSTAYQQRNHHAPVTIAIRCGHDVSVSPTDVEVLAEQRIDVVAKSRLQAMVDERAAKGHAPLTTTEAIAAVRFLENVDENDAPPLRAALRRGLSDNVLNKLAKDGVDIHRLEAALYGPAFHHCDPTQLDACRVIAGAVDRLVRRGTGHDYRGWGSMRRDSEELFSENAEVAVFGRSLLREQLIENDGKPRGFFRVGGIGDAASILRGVDATPDQVLRFVANHFASPHYRQLGSGDLVDVLHSVETTSSALQDLKSQWFDERGHYCGPTFSETSGPVIDRLSLFLSGNQRAFRTRNPWSETP